MNLPYATIALGIEAVVPGGKVIVAAGTYAEALTLNKPLKLIGAGSASTTINGGITIVAAASGVAGDPTLIKGLDINGPHHRPGSADGIEDAGWRQRRVEQRRTPRVCWADVHWQRH